MKLIVANWKMNPQTVDEARTLASKVEHGLLVLNRADAETVVCPPAVFLPAVFHALHLVKLGAQNVAAEEQGAFTGEISGAQLSEYQIKHCIVGHSERRAMGEDDEQIGKKIHILLKLKIHPILCVGFGAKKGAAENTVKSIVAKQIRAATAGLRLTKDNLTVAYEPVWAIGTGKPATPAHAADMASHLRGLGVGRVLYGGSMDGKNAAHFAEAGLDGGLIGGASLKYEEFLKIVLAFSS